MNELQGIARNTGQKIKLLSSFTKKNAQRFSFVLKWTKIDSVDCRIAFYCNCKIMSQDKKKKVCDMSVFDKQDF